MGLKLEYRFKAESLKQFLTLVNDLAVQNGYYFVNYTKGGEQYASIELCKNGHLCIDYISKGRLWQMTGTCQTNHLGPGYHAAVVDFLDELKKSYPDLKVYDDTGYYLNRDFEKLQKESFNGWLKSMVLYLTMKPSEINTVYVCWPDHCFEPEIKRKDCYVSPMGVWLAEMFANIADTGFEAFAQNFFTWYSRGKDAWYYRNLGLYTLWMDCRYRVSERSEEDREANQAAIENLERAMKMDPNIPIPIDEYKEVCKLDKHEPMDVSTQPRFVSPYPIGYRKGWIRFNATISFAVPGSFLQKSNDESTVWLEISEHSIRSVKVTVRTTGDGSDLTDITEQLVKIKEGAAPVPPELKNSFVDAGRIGSSKGSYAICFYGNDVIPEFKIKMYLYSIIVCYRNRITTLDVTASKKEEGLEFAQKIVKTLQIQDKGQVWS